MIALVTLIIFAGAVIQSALGFGATMITMGFLPLIMEYSTAMGLSIVMVTISTCCISVKYRDAIRWDIMMPFLVPTAIICGLVNVFSAKVNSEIMYLLLGMMFVAVAVFFFAFSTRIHIKPTIASGALLGAICGVCYGLFASGGPTAALYFLPATDSKREYLATIQAFLFVNNIMILIISILMGRLHMTDMPLIGAGAAGLGAGSFLGLLIHDRIPADRFGRVIYAFVGIGGLWIIVTHLTGI